MNAISRIAGAYLVAVAFLVGGFSVLEPLFYTSTEQHPYSPWWENVNPLTGIAVAVGVVFGYVRKRAVESGLSPTRSPGRVSRRTCCSTVCCAWR